MTTLLELKERIIQFYGKNEVYAVPVIRFILAFLAFFLINSNIGYMTSIAGLPITIILALVCALLPINGTILIAGVLVLLHFYSLSIEVCLVALIIFVVTYLVYFRFAPKSGYYALLTPICFKLNIPYAASVGTGLLQEIGSVFSVICGSVLFFFIDGVRENANAFSGSTESDSLTSKITMALNQLLGNKEMYLVTLMLAVTTIVVYIIRRMEIENAWRVAWISGMLFQAIGIIAGYVLLGYSDKVLGVVIGGVISAIIVFVLEFMFCGLDYSRTERLQFEDDEYYYYVKAVPKATITKAKRDVKRFNSPESKEALDKKRFAQEMDIDENLLD